MDHVFGSLVGLPFGMVVLQRNLYESELEPEQGSFENSEPLLSEQRSLESLERFQ